MCPTYQKVVEFDLNSHGVSQGFVEREAGPWHKDILARVGQHSQGQFNSLTAATGQDHILKRRENFLRD